MAGRAGGAYSFIDLHCHSSASYDSLSSPADILRVAASRGLTHVAITDHERIDGALEAKEVIEAGRAVVGGADEGQVSVIVGEEIRSADGDLIGLFLERSIPAGLSAVETAAAIHEQGGLVGIPHPFDRFRFSGLSAATPNVARLTAAVDYIEAFNARVPYSSANARAADLAREHRLPGVAASDAHTLMEVGVAYTRVEGTITSAGELRHALASAVLVMGRSSFVIRGMAPALKAIQRLRGNRPLRGAERARGQAD